MGSENHQSESADDAIVGAAVPDDEIVVGAWSDRYARAADDVIATEGVGYVDDPVDRGGATKYGWSLRTLVTEGAIDLDEDGRKDFDLDGDGDIDKADVRLLTRGDAKFLYHRCFWLRLKADDMPRPIGEMLFDQGVNAGLGNARRLLQLAINRCLARAAVSRPNSLPAALNPDRVIGDKTLKALDWVLQWPALGMPAIIDAFRAEVRLRYRAIVDRNPSQRRFLDGWLNRANRLGRI